jgi:hypothetical protein
MHSSKAFHALDDPLKAAVLFVMVVMIKDTDKIRGAIT